MSSPESLGKPMPSSTGKSFPERAILFYQRHLSALKPYSTCRFDPVCSQYALDAIAKYGVARGLIKAIVRLCKCGPWHPGGYDPA